jgi:hypothetical protein
MNMTQEQDKAHKPLRIGAVLRRRVAGLIVAGAALAAPLAGVTSQPASASVRYAAVGDGLALRSGPGTQYPVLRKVNNGTPLDIVCQVQGGTNIGGNATWDKLVGGEWVSDYFTTTPSFNSYVPGLGDCRAPTGPRDLTTNQFLQRGQALVSSNKRFWLVMQGDGNLVVYDGFGWRWQSGTVGIGSYATIGSDGNFVIKNSANAVVWESRTRWSNSGTEGNGTLSMQGDGNLVIYDAAGEWTWHTNSTGGRNTDTKGITRTPLNNGLQVVLQGSGVNVQLCGYYNQSGIRSCPVYIAGRQDYQTPLPGLWWKGYIYVNKFDGYGQPLGTTKCYLPRFTAGSNWPGPPPLSNVAYCNI